MSHNLVAVIPANGKSVRLSRLPFAKELFPIGFGETRSNGVSKTYPKPVGDYILESLRVAGVRRVFIVIGYGREATMEYFGNGSNYDLDIAYLFQDNYQGMPYALDLAKPWLRADETVLFGMPDTIISPVNIFCELVRHHSDNLCDLTLGAFSTEKPQKFCMVDFDKSRVISVIDKPERTYLKYMWGVACWSENFIESMHKFLSSHKKEKEEVLFSDVIQDAILSGLKVEIKIFDDGNYLDIGTLEDLKSAIINYSQKP